MCPGYRLSRPLALWSTNHYRRLHLRRGHETKKHVLIGCQTCDLPPSIYEKRSKPNRRAKGKLFMFLMSAFRSYVFHFSQPSGIYVSLRNSTLVSRNYTWRLTILASNILLSENKSSRQQTPTPNFECLAEKHVMYCLHLIRTCFSLTFTRLKQPTLLNTTKIDYTVSRPLVLRAVQSKFNIAQLLLAFWVGCGGGGQGMGWGFDIFQKFAVKFPARGQITAVKCNQISPPWAAHCCQVS